MDQVALLFIAILIAGHPSLVVSKEVISPLEDDKNVDLKGAPDSNTTSSLSPDPFIVPVIEQMTKESQPEKLCELITSLGHMCQSETDQALRKKCMDTVKYAKTKAVKVRADCVKTDSNLGPVEEKIQFGRSSAALGKSDNEILESDPDYEEEAFGSDDSGSSKTMDYNDPETVGFQVAYKAGEDGASHARKKIILFSVFSGLFVVAGLAVIIIAFVFSGLAFKKRSKRSKQSNQDTEMGEIEETGVPTNNRQNEENQASPETGSP